MSWFFFFFLFPPNKTAHLSTPINTDFLVFCLINLCFSLSAVMKKRCEQTKLKNKISEARPIELYSHSLLPSLLFSQPPSWRSLPFHKEAAVHHCGFIQQCCLQGKFCALHRTLDATAPPRGNQPERVPFYFALFYLILHNLYLVFLFF